MVWEMQIVELDLRFETSYGTARGRKYLQYTGAKDNVNKIRFK